MTDDSSIDLGALGWSERWEALFTEHAAEGLAPGRVVRSDRGSALVATAQGTVRAETSKQLMRDDFDGLGLPAAGDWVALRHPPGHDVAIVEAILTRRSAFTRGDPGKATSAQVLAANIDIVFVVHPISEELKLRRIERELAVAWESGATPVVVLTKEDLAEDAAAAQAEVEAVAIGVDVLVTSAETGEGIDKLAEYAHEGNTIALIGPSGVGKSSLVNALLGEERQEVREVREGDGKGRHTTTSRELITLPSGGVLVDTPGMRALAVWDLDEGLIAAFPDIAELAPGCRFRDCTHTDEPGCAVTAAVEAGDLAPERLESWHKLLREMAALERRQDALKRKEHTAQWRSTMKSLKHHHKYQR